VKQFLGTITGLFPEGNGICVNSVHIGCTVSARPLNGSVIWQNM
jgi:hypothetical protein